MTKLIINAGEDWTFEKIDQVNSILAPIAKEKYLLDIYPNQFDVVNYEQMLDCYSSVGMPLMYDHWSFGETFLRYSQAYKADQMGLAYEMVINSSPCISYLMEQNTMVMQALVIAHAAYGHNHFFKNNYLFREWTDAESIIDYLNYAKKYIRKCEEKYGNSEVEALLDAAHALKLHGIDRYKRPSKLSREEEERRKDERERYVQSQINELWNYRTPPKLAKKGDEDKFPKEPQENILYFLEKNAPRLESWQREILRITRKINQYFYPQTGGQTQIGNEGFATLTHYNLMNDLYDAGHLTDGAMEEFFANHTAVIRQPDHASRFNPYAIGFAIYQDIERVSTDPTDEDKLWFGKQDWIGNGKPAQNVNYAAANYRDESFILQYLSPTVMRKFKMFSILDNADNDFYQVTSIHNEYGYKEIRKNLSELSDLSNIIPDIHVTEVDRWGDRTMILEHSIRDGIMLHDDNATNTLNYIAYLWKYPVLLQSIERSKNEVVKEWTSDPDKVIPPDYNLSDL